MHQAAYASIEGQMADIFQTTMLTNFHDAIWCHYATMGWDLHQNNNVIKEGINFLLTPLYYVMH